ncbi:MAG TPA: hypothetical protein VMS08_03015 [Candidatus Saccharimonadia bacterium]|nr:hypothetical protein [Candidatus Saccharimonadia bacterium]
MSEYDASIMVLQAISDMGSPSADEITAAVHRTCRLVPQAIAQITGHLIKIGLVVGYPGAGGNLVFELAG